jgi:hypothetical protein
MSDLNRLTIVDADGDTLELSGVNWPDPGGHVMSIAALDLDTGEAVVVGLSLDNARRLRDDLTRRLGDATPVQRPETPAAMVRLFAALRQVAASVPGTMATIRHGTSRKTPLAEVLRAALDAGLLEPEKPPDLSGDVAMEHALMPDAILKLSFHVRLFDGEPNAWLTVTGPDSEGHICLEIEDRALEGEARLYLAPAEASALSATLQARVAKVAEVGLA